MTADNRALRYMTERCADSVIQAIRRGDVGSAGYWARMAARQAINETTAAVARYLMEEIPKSAYFRATAHSEGRAEDVFRVPILQGHCVAFDRNPEAGFAFIDIDRELLLRIVDGEIRVGELTYILRANRQP